MEKINLGDLQRVIEGFDTIIISEKAKLAECNRKRAELYKEAHALDEEILRKTLWRQLLADHAIVLKGVRCEVSDTRTKLLKLMAQRPRTDLTPECRSELETSLRTLEKDLMTKCSHEFVVGYPGFHGSNLSAWADSYSAKRMCVVCGLSEYAEAGDIFKVLNDNPSRLVIRTDEFQPYQTHGKQNFNVWRPLEELLEMFVDQRVYKILKESAK